jgi:hypothetical protein
VTKEDRVIPDVVIAAYRERVSYFKKAKIYLGKGNIPKSVEFLRKYLLSVAAYWDVEEAGLNPDLFKDEGHVSEQLLISYAYWDLAKSYDRSESFDTETVRCLKQFVLFSIGFKYQYANSIMIRKYIRLNKARNKKAFQQAYEKLYVKIKSCFVATYAFHESHPVVSELQEFRDDTLMRSNLGRKFICLYYYYSPIIISFFKRFDKISFFKTIVFKPIVYSQYLLIRLYRKCTHDSKA